MSSADDQNLQKMSAETAYDNARHNVLRAYPSPKRGGDRLYPLAAPSAKPSFQMGRNDQVFTIGSCFARNVEASLVDIGMTVTSNESELGPIGDSLGFTQNFFNKYSIHSIYNDLKWALERDSYPEDEVIYPMHKEGIYADLQLGMPKLEFPLEQIRDFRSRYLDVLARVATADVVIITLGYVETWYDTKLGIYLNTSPPQPLVKAHPSRFEFRVLSYQDVLGALRDVYALLIKHRTKPLKMLVTVSPVPLLSTFRDVDVLVANTYSKSVQRAAIDEFIRDAEGVDYFPSYEFVILSNPEIAWARGDYRHVSPDIVARIMSNVVTQYVKGGAGSETMTIGALQSSVRMLYKMEDYTALQALGQQHADQFNSDGDLLVLLGNSYVKTRDMQAAFDLFQVAHNVAPDKPTPLERLITLCRPTRQTELAAQLLKKHELLFPDRQTFRTNAT
ncbi:GSCFA family protein [Roseovarius albus]|uniref:GSCFA family protein n=1 Tax=Roseovarius albus TaxID=1247867 RepID=A0A1X6ZRV5_9RHOB|nr:GSCFA domain-containing protein [Roseovarius albus]SLN59360.1 GSCFA family protein [Roseovarius albus]